jgi:hypothetical protein
VLAKLPRQRVAQGGEPRPQPTTSQIGQHGGVGGPPDERLQYGPIRDAEDVRGDGGQLEARVFQDLLEPVGFARPFLDQDLTVAGEPRFIVPLLRKCLKSRE